jgi:hypothetical protein
MRQTYPGYQYFDRILDKLNVETMMANRVAMGNYLDPKRFRWVFFVDSFLFPLDNSELTARNVDERCLRSFAGEETEARTRTGRVKCVAQNLSRIPGLRYQDPGAESQPRRRFHQV